MDGMKPSISGSFSFNPILVLTIAILGASGIAGCDMSGDKTAMDGQVLADKTGIPQTFMNQIRQRGENLRQLEGINDRGEFVKAKGVTIDVSQRTAHSVARELVESAPEGYLVFVSDMNFGIGGKPDHVSVLTTSDPYKALEVMGTNGWNYDISPEKVIARLKQWNKRFGLELRGVGFDWLEAEFRRSPADMVAFAKEVYEFCPDVVEQGTGTVEALADEMKRANSVYLWWD